MQAWTAQGGNPLAMEAAGPREKLFFDPSQLACGIVTCGGLCPGVNDVIRSIVLSLYHRYGVHKVYGFRFGYEGLVAAKRAGTSRADARGSQPDPRGRRDGPGLLARASGPC